MANNILQTLAQQKVQPANTNMLQQLKDFKRNYKGDPKQAVMSMLQSGQINNAQLRQAMAFAQQFKGLL